MTGGVASAVQVLVTEAVALLPQISVAAIVKICVTVQPLVVLATVALTVAGMLVHVSLAVTPVRTLFVVGILVGLHPKFVPTGTLFSVGKKSFNCVITCVQLLDWPAQSVAHHFRVMTFEQSEFGLLSVWL